MKEMTGTGDTQKSEKQSIDLTIKLLLIVLTVGLVCNDHFAISYSNSLGKYNGNYPVPIIYKAS